MIAGVSPDLPHLGQMPAGREWALRVARVPVAWILRFWWRARVHGTEHVPTSGAVILAANHIGLLDGPVIVALTGRLTFAMAKHELFVGPGGRLLAHLGQISLNRRQVDIRAINRAVQVLRSDRVLAVFPEGVRTGGEVSYARGGAAYLAMVSGAPVIPVAILGTREPGHTQSQMPRRGSPIHIVYGEPIAVPQQPWPRRKQLVAEWTEHVRTRLADHVVAAQALTGLPLPGPPKPKPVSSTTTTT
ncbi:MAG: 1-acyl-sn-glycerol-3-phosphate acyltransferase [Friedmanniella sp.]|nr:1-acyl-sn-glycerol-3-phosphate acyltransferase [Friedmanniella sp.]